MTLLAMDSCRQTGNVGSQWTLFSVQSFEQIGGLWHYDMDNDRGVTLQHNSASGDEDDVVIVGARVWVNGNDAQGIQTGDDWIFRLSEGSGQHLSLKFATSGNGQFVVYRANVNIASSAVGAHPTSAWFYLEFKVLVHDSAGTVQVRVDGTDVINETGLDTRNAGATGLIDRMETGSAENNSLALRFCDVVMMNEQGSAPFNDLIGPQTIESVRADGAGNYTNWDPAAGTNWESIDDPVNAVHDSDATYVETTVAERDSYTFGALASSEDPIAVQVKATSRFTGTQQDFNTFLRRSGTDDDGDTDTANTSNFADRAITIYETDPIAAGVWTKTNFEATEFGIRTTA